MPCQLGLQNRGASCMLGLKNTMANGEWDAGLRPKDLREHTKWLAIRDALSQSKP